MINNVFNDLFSSVSSNIANPTGANAYVFLCDNGDVGGVVGLAWLGGTCDPSGSYRSSITAYFQDDFTTSDVSYIRKIFMS